jgi:hypothetical protein
MADAHDPDEATLLTQLAAATDARSRGRIHAALAVCAGRALAYRRMNRHEEASAWAYAEDSPRLAAAMHEYRGAIEAFSARRDAEGLEGVRAARPVIVEELGALHPYAQQVTNTLAGRLGGAATLAERVALRRWLVAGREALFGRTHTCTLQHLGDLAYLLAADDDREGAMAAFEEAIDGLVLGPWPHEAARLLDRLARLCREAGTPERTRLRERRVLAASPSSGSSVRDVFFRRVPAAAQHFNAEALRHGATHLDATTDDEARRAWASALEAMRAGTNPEAQDSPTLAADWVIHALGALDAAERGPSRTESSASMDDEPEGPREQAERTRQDALFERLFDAE